MATPVKDIPVLTGNDARRFEEWIKDNENKKISIESYERIKAAGKKFTLVNS